MKKLVTKVTHPIRGIYIGLCHDTGVQFQVLFLLISAPLLWLFFKPLAATEQAILLIGYGLLFINEFQNSALEETLDHLHPEIHENVRNSKDLAAGSVLLSLVVFVGVVILLLLGRA